MRQHVRTVLTVVAVLTAPALGLADRPPDITERLRATEHHRLEGEAKRALWRATAQSNSVVEKNWAPDLGPSPVDVLRYELDLQLDPTLESLSGTVAVDLAATVDDLATVELDADRDMSILGVVLVRDESFPHDGGRLLAFTHAEDRLRVQLHRRLSAGEEVRLLIAYGGHGRRNGAGVNWAQRPDGTPLVTTFSQPLGARIWWPCSDRPDDKAIVSLEVTAPSGLVAASNGLEVARVDNGDGTATTSFASRYPISTYLVVLNLTNYVRSATEYRSLDGATRWRPIKARTA